MSKLSECVEILDHKRIPLSNAQREGLAKIFPYYGAQGVIDYVDNYLFDGEYILVAEDGNNLKSLSESIATWATGKFWVNNHAHILGAKEGYSLKFIYYLLNCMDLRGYITGSAQPKFNQENLANVELQLPDINIQNSIAKVLSTIDEKIANNNAICAELEAMVKLLYDYWFVQFDFPDENGKPYKSSGGKMVWSEELKREIPEGWEVKPFSALASFKKGKIPLDLTDVAPNDGYYPYLTIDVANGGTPQFCNHNNMPVCNGETIMVMDGAASGDVYVGCHGVLGSTFSMISALPNVAISNALIYRILKSKQVVYKKANTGSTVPHANRSFIESMPVCLPKNVTDYAKQFDTIQEAITHNQNENQKLANLRNFLLPLLMNGQVTFKEADCH